MRPLEVEVNFSGAVITSITVLIIPEKRVVYVVSIVDYQDRCRPHKRRNWIVTHVGLSAHAHNIVQEVEVHGWLLSGIEEVCCSFLTLVANK